MTIIDRYVLRQFSQTFFICFLSLTGLYIVFDAFTNLDNFLRCAEKNGSLMGILGWYYGCQSLLFFDRFVGMLTLTAAMFTVTWLQRHQELTALMAAGLSKSRVVTPIIGGVAVIIVAGAINRELVIPRFRNDLARKPKDLVGDVGQKVLPQYDDNDVYIRGENAFADKQRIEKPVFRFPATADPFPRQIAAREATYLPAEKDRPAGYLLQGVEQPKDIHLQASLYLQDEAVAITPRDAPDWLQRDQVFIASNVTFEQLTTGQGMRDYSSTLQLIQGLYNGSLDYDGRARVMIHSRILQPFMDMTLLLLGLPMVLSRNSRNVFFSMALGGIVVAIFMLVTMAFQRLGAIYVLSPALAAWAPLMIFAPVAVEMTSLMRN